MRVRNLLAAVAAATLALGGAVGIAQPAHAADCETDCLELTIDAPARLGVAAGWSDAGLTITNGTEGSLFTEVRFSITADVELWPDTLQLEQRVVDSWQPLTVSAEPDGALSAQTPVLVLPPGTTEIPMRVRATSLMLTPISASVLGGTEPVDPASLLEYVEDLQGAGLDLSISAAARALVVGDPPTELTASGSTTSTVSMISIDVPTTLPVNLGEPTEFQVGFSNETGSDYPNVLVLPAYLPGQSPSEVDGLEGFFPTPADGVLVEVLIGDEWVPLVDLFDVLDEEALLALLLAAQDGESDGLQWRITIDDESLLDDEALDEDEGLAIPGNMIVWFAISLDAAEFDDFGVLQMAATSVVLAETPEPTPSEPVPGDSDEGDDEPVDEPTDGDPTEDADNTTDGDPTENADSTTDDAGVDDAGDSTTDGAAPTGEVARTGYDLTGQAATALLLLVLGGSAVLAGRQRRKPVADRA